MQKGKCLIDLSGPGKEQVTKMAIERKEGGMPVSEAVDLAGLVEYGEGAVVSRTLIQAAVGTVTVFAFDMGQGLSEHSTPFDALVQILDGRAEITIGGEMVTVAAGESLLMPADIPHALHAPERYKMLLTMIREKKQ
jgi:quercetin dioxygenase-like cupin family protein